MSNVSIYEKNWIDLVFENKNQNYGAYVLRQQQAKTTFLALFIGVLFLFSLFGLGFFISSFSTPKNESIPYPIIKKIITINYNQPHKKEVEKPKSSSSKLKSNLLKPISNFVPSLNYEVTKIPEIKQNDNSQTMATIGSEPSSSSGIGASTLIPTSTGISDIPKVNTKTTYGTESLDVLPMYPGGMSKFYSYIMNNFEKPELEGSTITTVLVSFIIETDGSISNIKVLRNTLEGMDLEAIRVLKSIRDKWTPGIKEGQKVRTNFILPIKIKS